MDYEYDLFISYKRNIHSIDWIKKFISILSYWLTQCNKGEQLRMFFDESSIENGTKWQNEIINTIKVSKCIFCIWSPEYFKSNWCVSEWESFEARESLFNNNNDIANSKKKIRLIYPVRFHDGEHYPSKAKSRQSIDISEFTYTTQGFWKTTQANKFEKKNN